jgi:hypothetical protein
LNGPAAEGVPLIVIVFAAQDADTPAGSPLAPATPLFEIPVAPVVVCVMAVSPVLMHMVGVEDAMLTVLFGVTVMVEQGLIELLQ